MQRQCRRLGALKNCLLDPGSEEGELQVHPEAALGDPFRLGNRADVPAFTNLCEPTMRPHQVGDELHIRERLLVADHQTLFDTAPLVGQRQRQLQGTAGECVGADAEERCQPLAAEHEIHALAGQRAGID